MFSTDEAVNYILNYSKMLVDQINVNRDCPKELKCIQYLIFAGMVSYYGFEEIENIYKAFKNSKFVYTKDSFAKHIEQFNLNDRKIEDFMKVGEVGAFVQCGVSQDLMGRFYIDRNVFVIDNGKEAPDFFLEKVVHEVNHVVNSINNPICIMNNQKALRTGLYVSSLTSSDTMGIMLEEDFNVLQTADIMEHILMFTQYDVCDPEIRRALDKIKYAYGKKRMGIGYDHSVNVFRDLYSNSKFKKIVSRQRMSGVIKPVRLDFEGHVGDGSYKEFSDILEKVELSGPLFWERSFYENKAKQYIKKYNEFR